MRLIDADALTFTHDYVTADGEPCITKAVIDAAPTIDAVPVVRCKDCFLYGKCNAAEWYGENGNGYCSVGDRRKDND